MARRLSALLGIPHIELDALFWGPNWTPVDQEVFRQRVDEAVTGDQWVSDGNYRVVRDIVWARANTVVWLDYPLGLIMWRLVWRTFRRVFAKEELWSGNRERFREQFFSPESLLLWALSTYRRRRRQYEDRLRMPEYAHLTTVRLRSPRAAREWLSGVESRWRTDQLEEVNDG